MQWNSLQRIQQCRLVNFRYSSIPCSYIFPVNYLEPRRQYSKDSNASNIKADVVVCGAGLAGLSVAHGLSKRGVNVAVFDRDW